MKYNIDNHNPEIGENYGYLFIFPCELYVF